MEAYVEQRQHVRQHVQIEGIAVLEDGLVRIPITIVNLSRSGAMLQLADFDRLPESFVLLFKHSNEPCRTTWQVGQLRGVEFVDAPR